MRVPIFFQIVFSFSLDKCPEVEFLMIKILFSVKIQNFFLIFWETFILFYMVTAPTYIPIDSAQVFLFLLTNTCCFFLIIESPF